jgi:hypothetical protein
MLLCDRTLLGEGALRLLRHLHFDGRCGLCWLCREARDTRHEVLQVVTELLAFIDFDVHPCELRGSHRIAHGVELELAHDLAKALVVAIAQGVHQARVGVHCRSWVTGLGMDNVTLRLMVGRNEEQDSRTHHNACDTTCDATTKSWSLVS